MESRKRPSKDRHKTIELLAKHEEALGRLYEEYAGRFPEQHAFWLQLSEEEYQHAEWIRTLDPEVKDYSLSLSEDRFSPSLIEESLAWVTFQTGRAQKGDLSMDEALTMALDVENSLIDNKCFEVFEQDPPEFKRVLRALASATESHRQRVENAWRNAKGSPPQKD